MKYLIATRVMTVLVSLLFVSACQKEPSESVSSTQESASDIKSSAASSVPVLAQTKLTLTTEMPYDSALKFSEA